MVAVCRSGHGAAGAVVTPTMLRDLALLFIIESETTPDDDAAARLGNIAEELDGRAEDIERLMRDENAAWGMTV